MKFIYTYIFTHACIFTQTHTYVHLTSTAEEGIVFVYDCGARLCALALTWRFCTQISEQNNIRQAAYCYTKAVRADPNDTEAHFHRAAVYTTLGDYKPALECKFWVLAIVYVCVLVVRIVVCV